VGARRAAGSNSINMAFTSARGNCTSPRRESSQLMRKTGHETRAMIDPFTEEDDLSCDIAARGAG